MTTTGDPLVGSTLGPFRITKVLGQGGMGTVYLGEHSVIGSRVAIKVLLDSLASDEGLVARFYAEARAVNLIGHENIVNIFDMNVVPPNRYYLVMEYLDGQPLNALLTQPVPADVAIPILVQVCEALQAAHDAGIVHRDLKPENIFLVKRGRNENVVKVLDFGLAKLLDAERSSTQTAIGLIVGTPEFMSPEQANSAPVDGRSDIYSLGCIAWLLATAQLPFPQRGLTDLLVAHRGLMPKPPHQVVPSVPKGWSDAIMKAMAKPPLERFQTAREFGAAMEAALTTSGHAAPAESKPGSGAKPPPSQQRHTAQFEAIVARLDGTELGTLKCNDISKGGMFLSTVGELPPIYSKLKITIPSSDNLELLAEVVRHVPADQAKAWGMSPGFGVQFLDVTPSLRDDVNRLVQGLPAQPKPSDSMLEGKKIESRKTVGSLLNQYRERMAGDHYVLLGLPSNADMAEVRAACSDSDAEVRGFRSKTLKPAELAQLDAALTRIKAARDTLGNAGARARYDANRGNWKGIARCVAGGLGPLDLERYRQEFLVDHPSAAGSGHVKFLASKAYEQNSQLKEALDACENALQIDPLNLQLHQRYTALSRKLKETSGRN